MTKVNRREAIGILLLGLGSVAGCSSLGIRAEPKLPAPVDPSLPQACVWLPLSYDWFCYDFKTSSHLPILEGSDGMVPAGVMVAP